MSRKFVALALSSLVALACNGGKSPTRIDKTVPVGFINPVLDQDFPDPAVLRASDGFYYAYATQTNAGASLVNIQGARSSDLVTWTPLGEMLPARPAWAQTIWNFWAPHVVYAPEQSKYIMYYAARADTSGMCLAIATSVNPSGPFTDLGAPLACGPGFSHIDAMAFDDSASGKRYLYWGSDFKPIMVQELAADRVHFATGSAPVAVVDTSRTHPYEALVEGPWVIKRGTYYYLFYSGNDCCNRDNPHYAVMVARATSPTGPFQKLGAALGSGNSVILEGNAAWLAPGHNAIITDKAGTDWIVYHAIDPNRKLIPNTNNVRRPMLIDKLVYTNGWPAVDAGAPTRSDRPKPVTTP